MMEVAHVGFTTTQEERLRAAIGTLPGCIFMSVLIADILACTSSVDDTGLAH